MGIKAGTDQREREGPENRPGVAETADAGGPAAMLRQEGLDAPDTGWETVGDVSRLAGASVALIRRYCDLGLIECARDRYGRRLFRAGTAERVKKLKAERVAATMKTRSA